MKTMIIGDEYNELFEKATKYLQELGEEAPQITNLSQYFKYLDKLTAHGEYEFLRIPLDEDEFVINTTSREIQVPENVVSESKDKNNAWIVGVVGDHRAETLWFKVDRYFDGQDLSICFPVEDAAGRGQGRTYVIWQNGSVYTFDEVQYVQIDEEVIRFAWTLRDEALYKDGNLTFAVSFNYHNGLNPSGNDANTTIPPLYSFNTQYVTIPIHKSITSLIGGTEALKWNGNISIESNIEDQDTFPRFSGVYNSARGARPEILTDLNDVADLDEDTGMVELSVNARPVGIDAVLQYRWSKDGVFVEFEEEADNTYIAEEVGIYKAHIGNQKGDTVRWVESSECVIPAAAEPVIKTEPYNIGYVKGELEDAYPLTVVAEYGLDATGRKIGEIHYDWYYTDLSGNNKQKVLNGSGIATATAENEFYISLEPENIGIYNVEIYNSHNKTVSTKAVSKTCMVKKNAVKPSEVTIEYSQDDKSLRVTNVVIDNNYDLLYSWYAAPSSNKPGYSTVWSTNSVYYPTEPGQYYCMVKQSVFPENNSYHTESAPQSSNYITINQL